MNIKSKKGFTLVEIIAAALIITIASAGTFSAYVLARKFSNRFAYKSQATKIAAAVADELRYRYSFEGKDSTGTPTAKLDIGPTTLSAADLSSLNTGGLLTGLSAEYTVTRVWFLDDGSGTISETSTDPGVDGDPETRDLGTVAPYDAIVVPPYHKKITVTVGWTEPV